ncbi:hypothetical protein ACV3W4_15095 [Clostridium perfringens]|uniref:hypothetical protein n=1 Tax=Clostridium perfringens TaxID=1502 RepID=UPI00016BD02C|nr:hypothetical protein [Clostridium perfringens]EDT79776.1 hypothetical protein AC7_2531 [Clostridium perfringens NCTC 8239]NGT33408.1 hypothetical protein [Clostridium perfringens]NGU11133.1 hypothetical protein [Clostridium perfringens]
MTSDEEIFYIANHMNDLPMVLECYFKAYLETGEILWFMKANLLIKEIVEHGD